MIAVRRPRGATLSGWRLAAAGVALFAVAVVAVLVVAERRDGGSPPASGLTLPVLSARVHDRAVGASLRAPVGWSTFPGDRALSVRSADHLAVVTVASPVPASGAQRLARVAADALVSRWRGARVGVIRDRRLAGRPAHTLVLSGSHRRGLVIALRGRRRAYLVEVLTARATPPRRLVEAQLMLGTLRLTR